MKDIICSIGPVSYDKKIIKEMMENGMTWARLNFSHGSYAEYERVINDIGELEKEMGKSVVILQDLQGPKIRVGEITPAPLNIEKGELVVFDVRLSESINAPVKMIPVQYENFAKDLEVGEVIYVDDGQLCLEVTKVVDEFSVECVALNSWLISSHKGINLPSTKISCEAITDKDKEDLKAGLGMGIDVVSLSFVRTAKDLKLLKELIREFGYDVEDYEIMAKIERPEAMENLSEILDEADCVMIARGDLGIEIGLENLGKAQKMITKMSLEKGKKVYPATHFLKNMVNSPTPSRSEVVDVYNALLDGSDGILLSNETSVGRYPVECCKVIKDIIETL